ncbi:glycerophosphodiester phosphodiesterase family protein [Roseivirga misakiensis]|uniref:Glycerophosphodiester phosphodiesterase n=1 Tax=Roseivirga misakiensis TaxID=1563681 RepID=A0A1E5T4X9_9BACT|nr:glycerophosphodiester phosphodiesterase family protein [Roseivirga misakiensis]OEK06433.1 glycerophosphodiester phosphodiesterase [Roseivirga misakiensis]
MFSTNTRFTFFLLILFCFSCSQPAKDQKEEPIQVNTNAISIPDGETKSFYSWSDDRIPMISAHRGGPYPGFPENAIETFDMVLKATPAVIECDIEMTLDSVLVMMHDNSLDRTTNGTGLVRNVTWEYIQSLQLVDNDGELTDFKVPTLLEVLEWTKEKALLTLDVKRGVPFQKVIAQVRQAKAEDYSAIITYSANDAQLVYQNAPELMISVGIGNIEAYEAHKKLGIPDENMIAFTGVSEPDLSIYKFLHEKGIYTILGVLGNLDKKALAKGDSIYADFINRGADILATDRPIEAANAISGLIPENSSKSKYFK